MEGQGSLMAEFFRVRNWERFQHYGDRPNAPWIKYYVSILEDPDIATLPDEKKAHLFGIWLLASKLKNRIPENSEFIGKRINSTTPVDLNLFYSLGFIQKLSNGYQNADEEVVQSRLEVRGDKTREEEISATPPLPRVGPETLLAIWNSERGRMRACRGLNTERRRSANARLRETPDLERWRAAAKRAAATKFCVGDVEPTADRPKPWIGNFEWFIRPNTLLRIEEGIYDDKTRGARPSRAEIDGRVREFLSEKAGITEATISKSEKIPGDDLGLVRRDRLG
jgi:hypothetical protein